MKHGQIALLIAVLAFGAAAGYFFGARPDGGAQVAPPEKTVLYWYDPMVPDQRFDKPGKSPFMDMDLVPKYAGESESGGVAIDARVAQNIGVRTARVTRGKLAPSLVTVASITPDERRIAVVQARAAGWVESLHVRAVNDPVKRGAPLAAIYAPELLAAQEEYLLLRTGEPALREAARQKMLLLGMTAAQIAALDETGAAQRRVVLHSPITGIVSALGAREGAQVSPGMTLFSIVDLSSVWAIAEVPEAHAAWIAPGVRAEATFSALPGHSLAGKVEYVYPALADASRTVQVRVRFDNRNGALRPGMYATMTLRARAETDALLVPNEAVIATGTRSVVIIAEGNGRFRPQDVQVGHEAEGKTEIVKGLTGDELVVVSGQFLIDSEASLGSALARLQHAPAQTHRARGVVEAIDDDARQLTITHEPIASLKWPEMTMPFPVSDPRLLAGVRAGDIVDFDITELEPGRHIIVRLETENRK